jgi:hypothetical protein
MPGLPAGVLAGLAACPAGPVHAACLQAKGVQPRGSPGAIQDSPIEGRGAPFLAAGTLLQALKTNLLGPFLIATQTTVLNAQLSQNQQHPIF